MAKSSGTPRPLQVQGSAGVTISGTAALGQVLTCNLGQWTGQNLSFTYRWIRDASTVIGGATAATYTLQAGDQTHTVKCEVTASSNAGRFGTKVVTSAPTGAVA